MRFEDGRQSQNIEDRRGRRPGFGGLGGRAGGLGIGGLVVLLALGYLLTGDPAGLLNELSDPNAPGGFTTPGDVPSDAGLTDDAAKFVSYVLADTEETWDQLFERTNRRYEHPTLVLFSDAVDSACGLTSAAVGPFYCPADRKVYIDLTFYRELDQRFGAPGDFAEAYVIAHEVGHHVQNLLGLFDQAARRRAQGADANAVSIQQELQADCLAGVWGHYAAGRGRLETGDLEEGLNAAAAIGDDTIQKRTQGRVSPESWTHGSSADRVRWFRQGLESGQIAACNTEGR